MYDDSPLAKGQNREEEEWKQKMNEYLIKKVTEYKMALLWLYYLSEQYIYLCAVCRKSGIGNYLRAPKHSKLI